MLIDQTIGLLAVFGLSVFSYVVGDRIGRSTSGGHQLGFLLSLLVALGFAWALAGRLAWAIVVPSASVVFWANLMPILLSLAAGFAGTIHRLSRWNRPATALGLALLASGYALLPLARPWLAPAEMADLSIWDDGVCLQSHDATCAPAAAATLLRQAGILSSEQSLARGCMTSRFGTEPLGLFRGLAIAAQHRRWAPRVSSRDPGSWHQKRQLPSVALVQFEPSESERPSIGLDFSSSYFSGPQGERHAIVVLGQTTRGDWLIADPAFGKTAWSDELFRRRFTGDAIFMAKR